MRVGLVAALGAAVMLAGCASNGGVGAAAPIAGTARGNYQTLASCVARKLDTPGIAKIDLPPENTSKVSVSSGGSRYWEITLVGDGPDRTNWSIDVINTMWGPFPRVGEAAEKAIRDCEAENPPVLPPSRRRR